MVLGYLLLAGAAYVAYRTNPDPKSFRTFLENDPEKQQRSGGGGRKGKSFFSKLLAPLQKHSVPNYTVDNYALFSVATVCDSSGATFLGVFGTWWLLSSSSSSSSASSADSTDFASGGGAAAGEDRAALERQKAVGHKGRRDYRSAASAFYNAGKLFELASSEASSARPGSGEFEAHEAATAFEEASKCYNMCNEEGRAVECVETAARLFRAVPRSGCRAARLYDSLGELYRKPEPPNMSPGQKAKSLRDLPRAVRMFKEAAELFEAEGDGRYIFSLANVAATQAESGAHAEAVKTYERVLPLASVNSALQFNVRKYAFNACVCALAASGGDWVDLERRQAAYGDAYPALFRDSREFALLAGLAAAVREGNDADAFADRCREYDALSPLEPWVVQVFLEQKKKLEGGVEDFR